MWISISTWFLVNFMISLLNLRDAMIEWAWTLNINGDLHVLWNLCLIVAKFHLELRLMMIDGRVWILEAWIGVAWLNLEWKVGQDSVRGTQYLGTDVHHRSNDSDRGPQPRARRHLQVDPVLFEFLLRDLKISCTWMLVIACYSWYDLKLDHWYENLISCMIEFCGLSVLSSSMGLSLWMISCW